MSAFLIFLTALIFFEIGVYVGHREGYRKGYTDGFNEGYNSDVYEPDIIDNG